MVAIWLVVVQKMHKNFVNTMYMQRNIVVRSVTQFSHVNALMPSICIVVDVIWPSTIQSLCVLP